MITPTLHKQHLISVLKFIYNDPITRGSLGFKGGTAAMIFYDLPRISVDLDFNLLNKKQETKIFTHLQSKLINFGQLKESYKKRFTLFYLINYQKGQRNIKVEISRRGNDSKFKAKSYLGVPMLVMTKPDMMANKLMALVDRKYPAARDFFDVWYFLSQHWEINFDLIKNRLQLTPKQILNQAIKLVTAQEKNFFLQGLGELLDEKQKSWVRDHLQKELLFELRLAKEVL
ncbi:nucleotidyl transferase AbiEii/AbiGii toxin family protein [Patescibacteria group bacterium]|nr:nucleotidyl transferase AbiEii/AbiGii toxin family protein [Patescibacteria group bacterium]MBU1885042.1 nucleotidyl transferase AbiEii/AbiGii toxin family protein [Patescibacteria group bacterium]